jgi:hypothetical protein
MPDAPEVPPFSSVFFPLHLKVDAEVDGTKVNYAFETAAAIYARPSVAAEVAKALKKGREGWQNKPDPDSSVRAIVQVVIDALIADLKENGARYADKPEDPKNPVPGLMAGQKAKNKAIIDKLMASARTELLENALLKENNKPAK